MRYIQLSIKLSLLGLMSVILACSGSKPITFVTPRPPELNFVQNQRLISLGFNGDNIKMNARLNLLFTRQLQADTTLSVVDPSDVIRALSGRAFITGNISDSLALQVGQALNTDLVLIGELSHRYTEEYGEQKKFRMIEGYASTGTGGIVNRLKDIPYQEPYIDQVVTLKGTIRALETATGQIIGSNHVVCTDTLHIVLPTKVDEPPDSVVVVDRVTPHLLTKATGKLARQLSERFSWQTVSVTRYVKQKVKGGKAGWSAAQQGNWDQARALWEQTVEADPENPGAWNNLAVAYEQAGRLDEARRAYDKAITLKPKDQIIRRNMAGGN